MADASRYSFYGVANHSETKERLAVYRSTWDPAAFVVQPIADSVDPHLLGYLARIAEQDRDAWDAAVHRMSVALGELVTAMAEAAS